MIARQGFAFFGTRIGVTSDESATPTWLSEFLSPAFELREPAGADFVVEVCSDPTRYGAIASARPSGTLPTVPCFARDEKITRRPTWHWQGHTVLDEDRLGALYLLIGNRIEVLRAPDSGRFRTAVMRVVREVAVAPALLDGRRILLHAAAVAHEGAGVLFAGPRTCGKTTMLSYAARAAGTAILANDRVVLTAAAGTWDARGVPTIVSLRPGTLELMPELLRRIPPGPTPVELTLAEAAALGGTSAAPTAATRIKVSPAQLAHALGTSLATQAPLVAIAFPDPRGGADEVTIERLAPAAALERLGGARFGLHVRDEEPTVFARLTAGTRPPEADDQAIARLAAEVPCFTVRIGANALRGPAAAAHLFDALRR